MRNAIGGRAVSFHDVAGHGVREGQGAPGFAALLETLAGPRLEMTISTPSGLAALELQAASDGHG